MSWSVLVDIVLGTFVWVCLVGIVVLNLVAMFGDYFIRRSK